MVVAISGGRGCTSPAYAVRVSHRVGRPTCPASSCRRHLSRFAFLSGCTLKLVASAGGTSAGCRLAVSSGASSAICLRRVVLTRLLSVSKLVVRRRSHEVARHLVLGVVFAACGFLISDISRFISGKPSDVYAVAADEVSVVLRNGLLVWVPKRCGSTGCGTSATGSPT